MSQPDIALTISSYNLKQFIRPCLDAYLAQSVPPRELIVVDDGSTDGSKEILRAYAAEHPQVRLVDLPQNLGVEGVFKTAVLAASSGYIYAGALDDFPRPNLMEKLTQAVELYPQASVYTVNYRQWLDQDQLLPNRSPEPAYFDSGIQLTDRPTYFAPADMVSLIQRCKVPAFGIPLYRREFVLRSSLLDRRLGHYTDLLLNLMGGFETGLVHLPEILVDFRMNFQSYGAARRRTLHHEVETLRKVMRAVNAGDLRHVRPFFLRSGFFGLMGWRSVLAALSSPSHWNLLAGHFNRQLWTVATPKDLRWAASKLLRWLRREGV